MSRSISQIYAEAVARRNDYLQISPLDSGRSEAKLSVINVLTYVMAALIYSYEILLDVFQVQVARLIAKRINGTARYYAEMALYFQFNPTTQAMDEMEYDDANFQFKFKTIDTSHRIVVKSAYQEYKTLGTVIKICKANTNSSGDGGALYMPLTDAELMAFTNYMDEIKFLGAKLAYRSILGDLMSINATIVYDDLYIDQAQAFQNVKDALIAYAQGLDFNGYVYYQSVIDAIQNAAHIVTISGPSSSVKYAQIKLSEYDPDKKAYKDAVEVVERCTPASGYLTFVDETSDDNASMFVIGDSHLIFKASSSIDDTTINPGLYDGQTTEVAGSATAS